MTESSRSAAEPADDAGRPRILVIDDEPGIRGVLVRTLAGAGLATTGVGSVAEARSLLATESFALVISDLRMPGDSGLTLMEELQGRTPEVAVLMVSGDNDPSLAEKAASLGAYGYLIKPFSREQLLISASNALRRRELELERRDHQDLLERTVAQRTAELRRAVDSLEASRRETIHRLSLALEMRDSTTGAHVTRIGHLSGRLATLLGLPPEEATRISLAAPMHDVGKIAIRDEVLLKPGPLTFVERREMQAHAEIGYRILSGSGADLLDLAAEIALTHHERHDGRGYPRELAGSEIPLAGRIVAVADVFDALLSDRPYREALAVQDAVGIMKGGSGSHFDPAVIEVFIDDLDHFLELVDLPPHTPIARRRRPS